MIHDLLRDGTREHHQRAESRLPLLELAPSRGPGARLRCGVLQDTTTLGRALGRAHVGEGATLGGQRVQRLRRHTLALTPESGCAIVTTSGGLVRSMWCDLTALLAVAVDADTCAPDEVLAGARDTVDAIAACVASALREDR